MSDHVWVVVGLVAIGCAHAIPTAPPATLEKKSFPEYNSELLTRKAMIFQNQFFQLKMWKNGYSTNDGPMGLVKGISFRIWLFDAVWGFPKMVVPPNHPF